MFGRLVRPREPSAPKDASFSRLIRDPRFISFCQMNPKPTVCKNVVFDWKCIPLLRSLLLSEFGSSGMTNQPTHKSKQV